MTNQTSKVWTGLHQTQQETQGKSQTLEAGKGK